MLEKKMLKSLFKILSLKPLAIFLLAAMVSIYTASATPIQQEMEGSVNTADIDTLEEIEQQDPFEPVNRGIFAFNQVFDGLFLAPAAYAYQDLLHPVTQEAVGNFFSNLGEPLVFLNDVLQTEFDRAAESAARFLINSTIGLLGLFDVAAEVFDIQPHQQDLGITLGRWGMENGPYVVLPILGPSNVRDTLGKVGDYFGDPYNWYMRVHDKDAAIYGRTIAHGVIKRQRVLGLTERINKQYDPYVQYRSLYWQNRRHAVEGTESYSESPVPSDIE